MLPLLVTPSTHFPYYFGRALVFQILASIAFIAWMLLRSFYGKAYSVHMRHPVLISFALFLVILTIAGFTGVDPLLSFWSSPGRMMGTFARMHFFAWLLALLGTVRGRALFDKLIGLSVGVSSLVAIHAIGTFHGDRAVGLLDNPIFLGVYLVFHLFFAGYLVAQYIEHRRLVVALSLGMILNLVALVLSGSRGALLGLIAGVFVSALATVWKLPVSRLRTGILAGAVGIFLVAGGIFSAVNLVPALRAGVSKGPFFVQRVLLADRWLETNRFTLWNAAIRGFTERPLQGFGYGNFLSLSLRLDDKALLDEAIGGVDRVHNEFLEILVGTGIFGFLAYLAFIGLLLAAIFRSFRAGERDFLPIMFSGLVAFYLVQNAFVFDTTTSLLFFVFAVALFLNYATRREEILPSTTALPGSAGIFAKILSISLSLVFVLFIFSFDIHSFQVSALANKAAALAKKNPEESFAKYQASVALPTFMLWQISEHISKSVIDDYATRMKPDQFQAAVALASSVADRALAEHPNMFSILISSAQLNRRAALYDSSKLNRSEELAKHALEIAPYRKEPYFELALIALARKDFEASRSWLRAAEPYSDRYSALRWYYVVLAFSEKRYDQVDKELQAADMPWKLAFQTPQFWLDLVAASPVEYLDHLASLISNALKLYAPNDPTLLTARIIAVSRAGHQKEADEYLKELDLIYPTVAQQARTYLRNITPQKKTAPARKR